jgi:hypothetical protein
MAGDKGLATKFGEPGDPLNGGDLYCKNRKFEPGELGCAHRTLPCGTPIVVQNVRTGKVAVCEVMDRGPYGAVMPSGKWAIKIKKGQPGKWRGIIDLSPALAKAISLNGYEKVQIFYPKPAPRSARQAKLARQKASRLQS